MALPSAIPVGEKPYESPMLLAKSGEMLSIDRVMTDSMLKKRIPFAEAMLRDIKSVCDTFNKNKP